ncbi:AraC family transcriptional regulator [Marinomonas sp. M1K-6]|uniref:AraC family transcriptional regulator n=1 Tax=Marinomonas profundi TaxID=2726122 RepID=A0A847RD15_9GAMM|nr:AraC family transcriptional regulator [Marinomonas profundi]NLQ18934.1 AraC family transcriptional regulator [Marinomonas profundi]UDV02326.1 AraC family transcriptional regulator [Marinomonas profundi]
MDLLSSVLSSLKVESTSISRWTMSAPWGVDVNNFNLGYCLSVVSGQCWVQIRDSSSTKSPATIQLQTGDSVIAPRGANLAILSGPDSETILLDALPWHGDTFQGLSSSIQPSSAMQVNWGGGGPETQLLGVAFTFQNHQNNFLLSSFPEYFILKQRESNFLQLIHPAIQFFIDDNSPGYFAVATQFSELIIMGSLRAYILSNEISSVGVLKGMKNKSVAKVLTAIHQAPQHNWTLPELAVEANISRSVLSKRFPQCVGVPPIDYLNRWRIHLAAEKLINSKASLDFIIKSLGFETDRTFRRLFKQYKELSPSQYRKKFTRV